MNFLFARWNQITYILHNNTYITSSLNFYYSICQRSLKPKGFVASKRLFKALLPILKTISVVQVFPRTLKSRLVLIRCNSYSELLQKGGVPAAPSGTATLLRLSPSYQFYPRPLLAGTDFRYPRLPWLDGRCVQGPGTYSPRHG